MINLLGISHSFQIRVFKPPLEGGLLDFNIPLACRFETYLENLVKEIRPEAICEEYSDTKIREHQEIDDKVYSIPKKICGDHALMHIFCDPDICERSRLYSAYGTTAEEDEKNGHPVREREWLRRIAPLLPHTSILFICGADHVATFGQKLKENGFAVEVISQNLEETWKLGC